MYDSTKPYIKHIRELIKQTWETPYVSIKEAHYPIIERKFSYPEVDHTDGIGTKGVYHWEYGSFENAAKDALAMNLNDLALMRARVYKLQNHIFLPQDNPKAVNRIIHALVRECRERDIAVTGGETSIHNNMNGIDISMTVSGFIKTQKPNRCEADNVLIGLGSNGLHSNGFTIVRKLEEHISIDRSQLITPTIIYSDIILEVANKYDIPGMMHITGGAYTKLLDIIMPDTQIYLKRNHRLSPQPIFHKIYHTGVSDEEMYKIFNCGIGFVLSAKRKDAKKIASTTDKYFKTDIIGEVKATPGHKRITIESMFSSKKIEF